jgi:glycosyltransferase involved in cell wall biosynthesis
MKILFTHQNFPAQFKHLAPALTQLGHDVKALAINNNPSSTDVIRYPIKRKNTLGLHPWMVDMESKIIRAEAALYAALKSRDEGFNPDVIIAHPGWGESLFLKDVWPNAKLGLYGEFYYQHDANDIGFDPEFTKPDITEPSRLRMKNAGQDLQFLQADAVISPTRFQCSTLSPSVQAITSVIHDGIDTQLLKPDENAALHLNGNIKLTKNDDIITFVNRNLEPMRGYHIFMRSLPEILRNRPHARVIIVGGDDVSYGAKPPAGNTWKQIFLSEVRNQLDMSRVHFVGKLAYTNFIKLLQISSVHVYLTYPFVLSWSLLEAMSLECAIVASDTAPVREVITYEETGLLVDFFDKEGLCKSICELLDNPEKRKRLGKAARELVITQYDLHSICLPKQIAWVEALAGKNIHRLAD